MLLALMLQKRRLQLLMLRLYYQRLMAQANH